MGEADAGGDVETAKRGQAVAQTQTQRGAVTLLDPAEQGGAGVGVFVEDCDVPSEEEEESLKVGWERKDRGDVEEDYMYGQLPPKWKPVTAMPPMAPTSMPPMPPTAMPPMRA